MSDQNKNTTQDQSRADFIRKNQKSSLLMAQSFIEENLNIISHAGNIYRYNSKCYDLMSEPDIDTVFLEFCNKYGSDTAWKNISSTLRAFLVHPNIKKLEKMDENLICVNNGIINLNTGELIPHSSDLFFDSCVNVDYDKSAGLNCPIFLKYLEHIFNKDENTIANVIRLGGYLLDTSCKAKKMFMFDGPGGSGKSTLIDTFSMFFIESMDSRNQITSLSLEELAGNGFDKALLINSRFNTCAETKKGFLDAEEIKKIITGDIIKVREVYSKAVNFRPKTKIVVACNGLPTFKDNSDAIFRRIQIIEFKNQYKSPSDYARIKDAEEKDIYLYDADLLEKIKKEKSAILNLFIGGLLDLKKNNYEFIDSEASYEAMLNFRRGSDTVREFLEDTYEADKESEMPQFQVYEEYKIWYRHNVQESGSFKFRSAELGKRIIDVFKVKPIGRKYIFNNFTQKSEKVTVYPLKHLEEPTEEEHIMTPEEVKETEQKLGISFNK